MKKHILMAASAAALLAAGARAQSAPDAMSLSDMQLRGTARFMSMGGAFTALGGDLSTLNQNPAGLGVYTRSEVGASLDIDINSINSGSATDDQTKCFSPNIGYAGAFRTGSSVLPYFNFGFTYGRSVSFDQRYRGAMPLAGSLTNYWAARTEYAGFTTAELNAYNTTGGVYADPYYDTSAPWMSILLYNAYGINPTDFSSADCSTYDGLYDGNSGTATMDVIQRGYVDEYNISLGGNISNVVYWGMSFGIADLEYTNDTYYSEQFDQARICNSTADGTTAGSASLGLNSWKHMWGTGFNFKAGLIVRPIPELRIGAAIHTPTYYNMNYEAWAQTKFDYSSGINGQYPAGDMPEASEYFTWKLRTPLRFMVGAAGVIDRRAIVSLDYELRPATHMSVQDQFGGHYTLINDDIRTYYRTQNILRLGLEYRIGDSWAVRAGMDYETSPVNDATSAGLNEVFTEGPGETGTQASYVLPGDTYHITCGLGWHYQNFYIDAAYVYRHQTARWHGYADYATTTAGVTIPHYGPTADMTLSTSRIVLSAGLKF